MVAYSSYVLDKLVLSAAGNDRPARFIGGIPPAIDATAAGVIIMRWMRLLADTDDTQKILLKLSGTNFTPEGASELAAFVRLRVIAERIVAVEMSGAIGAPSDTDDEASSAQQILVTSLKESASYNSVKLSDVDDSRIAVLLPLLEKQSLKRLYVCDAEFSPNSEDSGLVEMETLLISSLPKSTHVVCGSLEHVGFSNIQFDFGGDAEAGADAATIFGTIVSKFTSIKSLEISNCPFGNEDMDEIASKISVLILNNMQVRHSLKSLDLHGCVLNDSFGLVCDPLARCKNLEHVNLQDCNLTSSQIQKIRHKLRGRGGSNPPEIRLDSDIDSDESQSTDDSDYEFDMSQAI